MPGNTLIRSVRFGFAFLAGLCLAALATAPRAEESWDVTRPRGVTREIDFTIQEGTKMSVDVSPDGRWVVFDLLAHIYRVPAGGGEAECLTGDSGIALTDFRQFRSRRSMFSTG